MALVQVKTQMQTEQHGQHYCRGTGVVEKQGIACKELREEICGRS